MRRNFDNDRSAVATVTSKVRKYTIADTSSSVNAEVSAAWSMVHSQCKLAQSFTHNSWTDWNEDADVTKPACCTENAARRSQLYTFCTAVAYTMPCSVVADGELCRDIVHRRALLNMLRQPRS